ncbi:methyl-accepting chemotaxis protein [Pseudomonas marginalis]|nr:methyl-accepting chemotaxis protein [Pseudomonas marginalis]MCP1526051.1 methyl-accepting chemotaxis protein [Pseudomonas marginalis]MDQ0498635.1 methyl-accepting chemotaxis protein [Pseudomonas marginalis]
MQPLHMMTRAMQDIADGEGDLTRRLTLQNHDEFGILGNAFNRFVERIHTSIREVSSATGQVNEVALRVVSASNSSMINSDEQANRTNSAAAINQLGAAAQESAQQVQKMIEELQVGARDSVSTMSESQRHSLDNVEIANLADERLSSVTQRSGSDFDLAGGDASIYWPASRCFC